MDGSAGRYQYAFWLALDGFNRQVVGCDRPEPAHDRLRRDTAALNAQGTEYQSTNPYVPQRILFPYDVHFTTATEGAFPTGGQTTARWDQQITMLGKELPATNGVLLHRRRGPLLHQRQLNADSTGDENEWWLSQDLRVFTATPALNEQTRRRRPAVRRRQLPRRLLLPKALIEYLNTTYGDPSGGDPFDIGSSILPGPGRRLHG